MRSYPVIAAIMLLPFYSLAQTSINGVINSYHKVTQVIPANACLRVDNASGLSRGDLVLIIQVKGATVQTANTNSFGSVSSLNNAGNYEINTVCNVEGDLVYLFRQFAQSYTVADLVQLVRIPMYSSAIVTGTLQAAPWDSAAGKGGVLALSVMNDLILNAPMDASGKGFIGGAYMTSSNSCVNFLPASNWVYNATILSPQDGAYKGEGIANLSVVYSGGKGAAANGGGGGNNHNNGGGGGSNLVGGGQGGGNSSAAGCTVSNPGKGGYALGNSATKIFMGGGGGAGHANSGFYSSGGGAGGGIIIFHANHLISNGQKIMAKGVDGGNTIGDGASGGGAGGTIVMDVNNFVDAVNAEATGGKGGDENDDATSQRCYGEGGGGSGGAVYLKNTIPPGTINVNGGSNGSRLNSLNCAAIVAGADGANGNIVQNYSYIQSSTLSGYCGVALDVQLKNFIVRLNGNTALVEWQLESPDQSQEIFLERRRDAESWKVIYSTTSSSKVQLHYYPDKNLSEGSYQYRIRLLEKNGAEKFSVVRSISIGMKIGLYPNPASEFITICYPFKRGTKLKFVNALGEMVLQYTFHRDETFCRQNISSFRKGIYYVLIDDQYSRFTVQ